MNEFTKERFCRNLYYLRTLYGMTKVEASIVLGLSKDAYRKWEQRENGCRQKNMNRIMDLFRVDEYDLYVKDLGMYYEKIPEVVALIQNRLKPHRTRVKENRKRSGEIGARNCREYREKILQKLEEAEEMKKKIEEKKPAGGRESEMADMYELLLEYKKLGTEGRNRIKELIKLYQKAA